MESTNLSDADFLDEIHNENLKFIKKIKDTTTHTDTSVLLTFTFDQLGRLRPYDNKSSNSVEVRFKIGGDMSVDGISSIQFNNQVISNPSNSKTTELLGNEHTVANSFIAYAGVKPDDIKDIDIKVGEVNLSSDQKAGLVPKLLSV